MATVLTIANQKGGIGKTTTATALASGLIGRGKQALLIDTDPQCSASDTYQAKISGNATLYDLLIDNEKAVNIIQHTPHGDIIACDPLLADASKKLTGLGDEKILRKALVEILPNYDYIIIDTPPGAGILLHNALTVADGLIIPITADRYGLQGLSQLCNTIRAIQENTNPDLTVSGLLLVKHNERTNLSKVISENLPTIATEMNTIIFNTYIRESIVTKEAQTNRTTLLNHAPNSTTATDYAEFIDELLERGIL
jgi:chromosome partitioning protein